MIRRRYFRSSGNRLRFRIGPLNLYKRYSEALLRQAMRRLYRVSLALSFLATALSALSAPAFAITPGAAANGEQFLAAGLAFGLAALGAGVGVGTSGSAAIAAVTEKAEVRTTALIFVVLAEAIAIYGFAIAFIILGQPG